MVRTILLKAGLAYHRSHLIQTLLIVVGIALGVAVIVAIDMANSSISRSFQYSTESLTGKTTYRIVGTGPGLDQRVYANLKLKTGCQYCIPIIVGFVRFRELNMANLKILGIDPLSGGEAGDSSGILSRIHDQNEIVHLLARSNRILISEKMAIDADVTVGDYLTIFHGKRPKRLQIAGIVKGHNSVNSAILSGVIIMDIASAQEILEMGDRISHIDLVLDGSHEKALLKSIAEHLPAGVDIVATARRNSAIRHMTSAFEMNLRAMSLLALLVGIFLIYNTITFSVVRRRKQLGIFRALGTTRSEIFFIIVSETMVLGFIGSVLGLGLGILLGWGTVSLVMRTVSDLFFVLSVSVTKISVLGLLKALLTGLVASLISSLFPAYEAVHVSPVMAQRRSSVEAHALRIIPLLVFTGTVLIASGLLTLTVDSRRLDVSFSGLFLLVFGSALLVPFLSRTMVMFLQLLPGCRHGTGCNWALRNVSRSLSRTAVAMAALMIAVSVIVGVGIMVGSFRHTVIDWLNNTIKADIYVVGVNQNASSLDPVIVKELKAIKGVAEAYPAIRFKINSGKYLGATIFAIEHEVARRDWIWKSVSRGEMQSQLSKGAVFVSENLAWKFGIKRDTDSSIELPTRSGATTFSVAGVFRDFSSRQGMIVMDARVFRQHWQEKGITGVGLFMKPGVAVHPLMKRINRELAQKYEFNLSANAEIRKNAVAVFDRTFTITSALQILAALVAFIGVFNSIMAMMLERTQEIGILRANGMTVRQVWQLVLTESGIIGLISGILSIPLGVSMAWVLVFIINKRSFGWTLDFILEPRYFLQAVAISLVASLAAGIYPAVQIGAKNVAEALRTE